LTVLISKGQFSIIILNGVRPKGTPKFLPFKSPVVMLTTELSLPEEREQVDELNFALIFIVICSALPGKQVKIKPRQIKNCLIIIHIQEKY